MFFLRRLLLTTLALRGLAAGYQAAGHLSTGCRVGAGVSATAEGALA